jgi:hypothetical protein
MTYLELVKILKDYFVNSPLVERVENDDIPSIDTDKTSLYPLVQFYLEDVTLNGNTNQFNIPLFVADVLDINKQTGEDNRDFIWNQSLSVINNLVEQLRRGNLSETPLEVNQPSVTPFTDRLDKGLAGMETVIQISVSNDMTIC